MRTSAKRALEKGDNDLLHRSDAAEALKDELRELLSRYGLNEKEINDWLAHRAEVPEELRAEVLRKIAGTP